MGGNRRNRGGNSSNRNSDSSNKNHATTSSQRYSRAKTISSRDDVVLQQIQRGLFIDWREIGWCWVFLVLYTILGIALSVAAGMIISIHYFEKHSVGPGRKTSSSGKSSQTQFWEYSAPRVTMSDPMVLAGNTLLSQSARHALDLGTVVTTTESGHLNVLMVVEESTPLSGTFGDIRNPIGGSVGGESPQPQRGQYLNKDQANKLVPEYSNWLDSQPIVQLRETTIHPTTCKDGSLGFDSWNSLKAAVQEANSISAERFMKWSSYFANVGKQFSAFHDDMMYYEEDVIFHICPETTLKTRKGPIFLNAENIVIECEGCTIDAGGTHLAFGPHAKNAFIRGITFRGAHSSSLTFFHNGADATFEDCSWIGNTGINSKFGAVADINSTSFVNFYRCEIGHGRLGFFGGSSPAASSSLSIRVP